MSQTRFDVIVFGATSFVGQILCDYLFRRHGNDGGVRWAMAGRSPSKLASVRAALGEKAAGIELIVADAADEKALRAMCAQTGAVISTVGPYALYGSPLVKACVETGTDYVDLTGEAHWIRRMIEEHESRARKTGARLVHCCGFDSIPSDLGVHFHQKTAMEKFGEPATRIRMQVARIKGGASGGTVASILNIAREMASNPSLRKILANPYSSPVARPGCASRTSIRPSAMWKRALGWDRLSWPRSTPASCTAPMHCRTTPGAWIFSTTNLCAWAKA
jgi:short subunit dehydrogenase-like uncharacterized protein